MALDDVKLRCFVNVVGALDHVAFNENRNAVFIWSAAMCFIFVAPINMIFVRPLCEADIQCDCIINSDMMITDEFENLHVRVLILILIIFFLVK